MIRLRSENLFWRETGDEIIALDASGSRYYSANSSAVTLWTLLHDGATEADLAEALIARYGVTREVAAAAVSDFLAELETRGLLDREA
jgi:hypothetical protein